MPRSTRSVRHPLRLPDLHADPHNANRGTDRGRAALAQSLRDHGAGRAVLIDRHGRIIAALVHNSRSRSIIALHPEIRGPA